MDHFPGLARSRRWGMCGVLLIVLCTLVVTPALARAGTPGSPSAAPTPGVQLLPSATELAFQGLTGEPPLGRTFTLKAVGGAATTVRMSASDLMQESTSQENQTNQVILSTQVTINPAQVPSIGVDDIQRVDVTIAPGTAPAGTYKGELSIWYAELTGTTPVTVALEVVLSSKPTLAADANSINQTLFAQTRSFPYIGTASAQPDPKTNTPPPVLGELPITLIESSGADATIEDAEVLAVRSATGLILPSGAVAVATPLPTTVPGAGAATLPLVLQGRNLPAGSYTGTLRVQVKNQPAGVQVLFNLKLKDNWLWAFLVLAASLAVGALIAWYNTRGLAALKTLRAINRRASRIEQNPDRLQVAEREQARQLLAAIQLSARNEESQATIDAQVAKLDETMQKQAEAVAALSTEVIAVDSQIDSLTATPAIQQNLRKRRQDLTAKIEQGVLASLAEGKRLLDALKSEPEQVLKLHEAIAAAGLDDAQQAEIGLQTAGSVQEVGENLRALLIKQVDALITATESVRIGATVRTALVQQLRDARAQLRTASLNALSALIPSIKQIKAKTDTLQSCEQAWKAKGSPDGAVLDTLDAAATPAELCAAVDALQALPPIAGAVGDESQALPPLAGAGTGTTTDPLDGLFSIVAGMTLGEHASAQERAWTAYELKIQTGGLVVKGLLYLFAMIVGWAALYLSNQTFGERPEDYIALFLWGATVNVIGGQQLSLDAIYQHKTPDLAAATPANQPKSQNPAGDPAEEKPPTS